MINSVITLKCSQYTGNERKLYVLEAHLLICYRLYHANRNNIDESFRNVFYVSGGEAYPNARY